MSTTGRPTWRGFAAAGVAVSVMCAFLPLSIAGVLAEGVSIYGIVALLRGARRNGAPDLVPFQLIALGGSAFLFGILVRTAHGVLVGVDSPFPSPADGFVWIGYLFILAGLGLLIRRRSAEIEGDNLLDAILVAVGMGVVAFLFVIEPYLEQNDVGTLAQGMTVVYTILDLVLVSGIARLAVGSGRRTISYYLMGAAAGCVVLTDVFTTLSASSAAAERLAVVASPIAFLLIGAAGRHPSVARLTDPPELRDIQLTPRRLALLLSAVVGLIAMLLYTTVLGDRGPMIVAGAGAVAGILLVLGRLAMLVQANENKARREAILREAVGELAGATSTRAMYAIAAEVLTRLLGTSSTWIVETGPTTTVVARAGVDVHPAKEARLLRRAQALLGGSAEAGVDREAAEREPRLVLAAPVRPQRGSESFLAGITEDAVARQILDAMDTLASHLAGAIDGLLMAEEIYRREQEQRFRALIEHSSDMVTVLDSDGLVNFASPACGPLLGVSESQLVGRHPLERVHPEDRYQASGLLDRAWAVAGVLRPIEVRFRHDSGEWRWFEILVENLLDQPEVGAVIIHARDVTDRRHAQEELATSEARFRSLVQHTADLIAIVGDDLCLTYVSPAARSMLGYEPEALLGRRITDLIPSEQLFLGNRMLPSMSEAQILDANDEWRAVELTITDLRGDADVAGIVINARDVSDRKTLENKLRYLAMHDPLTGLANRNLLHDRLAAALADPTAKIAVLYVDVDDFKNLNDSLGYGYGDSALCEIARRITHCIRDSDIAARLGGDEFAILLSGSGARAPMDVARRVLEAVRAPLLLGPHRVQLTVSLGAAVREADSTVESLTRNADIAMYLAKTDGKDRRQLFDHTMLEAFNERIELKRDLQEVIDRGELRLVYQPVYDIRTGRMKSVEGLVRWDHPQRGLVAPMQFIPLAEESGHIREIGAWVLDTACAQLAAWRREGAPADLAVGVNLSVTQLEEDGLIGLVERTLLMHGLDASSLILEVTESVLAANVDLVQLQLRGLSSLGVRLALDDFGTGYSSLGYLQHFQLDTLKIDKSFLGDGNDPAQQEGLLRAIIDLAQNRGMATVAEGVEHEGQLAVLAQLGCDAVQGYLFAKPMAPEEVLGAFDRAKPYVDQSVGQQGGH